jgi:hypothetical protein
VPHRKPQGFNNGALSDEFSRSEDLQKPRIFAGSATELWGEAWIMAEIFVQNCRQCHAKNDLQKS